MSLSMWPALLGGSATTLDTLSLDGPFPSKNPSQPEWLACKAPTAPLERADFHGPDMRTHDAAEQNVRGAFGELAARDLPNCCALGVLRMLQRSLHPKLVCVGRVARGLCTFMLRLMGGQGLEPGGLRQQHCIDCCIALHCGDYNS